jgi:DMSO/TMAO reductase YedYZ molybdopterin-dependent catalytic subunit
VSNPIISRGFTGRPRGGAPPDRVPPGQYVTPDFPVLSAGPTPRVSKATWDFQLRGAVANSRLWTWDEFWALPREEVTVDIHCVTKWSKLDTRWSGVSVDTLLREVDPQGAYVTAVSDGGYTTNLPIADVMGGKAWIVDRYAGEPLPAEHGGPARLLVPHLYFWKSAKWVRALEVTHEDRAGFWEDAGYHMRGDPWNEERYRGD